ncbi:MAG TPA: hypothetical protein H9744_09535 [Candidatus Eisenbergiella stercoravium]|nr:hypothetical protein [Candidatus Eisenbergiella stercoravium]
MKIRVKEKIISAITVCLLTAALCACTQDSSGGLESAGETNEATVQETASEEAPAAEEATEGTPETPATETTAEETPATETTVEETSATGTTAAESSAGTNSESAVSTEPSETMASSPSVLTGSFVGWADNHTVEIIVDGVPTAFQVEDEGVKTVLESFTEGTDFSFEVQQEGEVRKISGLIQG